jgi:hypothetical protein
MPSLGELDVSDSEGDENPRNDLDLDVDCGGDSISIVIPAGILLLLFII